MLLTGLHQMHARHLAALRRSPVTIAYYFYSLEPLLQFMGGRGLSRDAELITLWLLREFQLWLCDTRGMRPGGEHAVLRGVGATLRWAAAAPCCCASRRGSILNRRCTSSPARHSPLLPRTSGTTKLRSPWSGCFGRRRRRISGVGWDLCAL